MSTSPYTFRTATMADKPAIVDFLRRHWDIRTPLIEVPEFFDYYYKGEGSALRFVLALREGGISALAGYIPANGSDAPDVWVSIWVADAGAQGAGLELMAAMPEVLHCRTLACNNIRPKTRAFYEFLGYATGRMGHFYRLADKPGYRLARVAEKDIPPAGGAARLARLENPAALRASGFAPPQAANPCKDLAYIEKRYFAYPRQRYDIYAAALPNEAPFGLLCTRTIPAEGTAVLRVSDYIGPPDGLPQLGAAIDGLMRDSGAEYADCYCAGIPPATLRAAGFAEREEDSKNILPNYLDPPLCENTEYYYFTSRPEGFTLFKADGDQDRPNVPLDEPQE